MTNERKEYEYRASDESCNSRSEKNVAGGDEVGKVSAQLDAGEEIRERLGEDQGPYTCCR